MRSAVLALFAGASAVLASNSAHVYLYPAQAAPATQARPDVVAQVLNYHLDLPQADPSVGKPEHWAFVRKASYKSLLEDNRNRLALYIDGVDQPADVLPSQTVLQPTHQISDSPSSSSWSALLASFGESAATVGDSMGLWGSTLLSEAHDAASAVGDWFSPIVSETKHKMLDWVDLAQDQTGVLAQFQQELNSISAYLDNMVSGTTKDSKFHALRIQSLGEIKRVFGEASEEYTNAVRVVQATIESAVARLQQAAKQRGQDPRFALILSSSTERQTAKRSTRSFDSLLRPFGKRVTSAAQQRAFKFGEVGSLEAPSFEEAHESKAKFPDPKKYKGKCFTSAESLLDATASCSGHGDAVEKIRGAKKCFRCQCKGTRTKNSKTYWAGEACEKVDLSSPTLLLLATGAGLIFLTVATIQFMIKEGELPLSGMLASVSVPTYKL